MATATVTDPAAAVARAEWLRRSHTLLLGTSVMLIVATPLIPSEAAVAFGSHVVLTMAWLVLTVAWLFRCLLDEKPVWHIGPTGVTLMVFLGVHSLSAVVMMHQGHGRPTLNALWLWISLGMTFLAVRQLARRGIEQRALVSVLIAMAVGFSAYGLFQTTFVYPQQRARYRANPDRVLNEAGAYAPVGSPQRHHFEDRLASTEPTGPFALTNSLAGFLVPSLVLLAGLAVPVWRVLRTLRRGAALGACGGMVAVAGIVFACLLLTKSRSGFLAALVGLGLLGVSNAVPRSWLRWPWLAGGVVSLVVIGVGVTLFGGLDRQVLTEAPKSLLYRFQYWQASAAMIEDHPWLGCGPGNFKDYYTHYKLPEASETIADPHNFLVEVAATAGLPALGLFALVGGVWLGRAWRSRVRPAVVAEKPLGDLAPMEGAGTLKSVYLGAGAGFLLAYPAGWAGGQSLALDFLWVMLPCSLLTIWLLQGWVQRGTLAARPMLIAVVALLVNLLAAGGIGLPGVAELLWVLAALTLSVTEQSVTEQSVTGPDVTGPDVTGQGGAETDAQADSAMRNGGPLRGRPMVFIAAAGALILVLAGYVTMYRPVLADHEFSAFLSDAMARPFTAEEVVQQSQHAAAADRWWSEPCEMWADALHQQWIDRPEPGRLAEFERVSADAQDRNRQSASLARKQGDWQLDMYAASGRVELLKKAVEAYARAVSLYPNNSLLHAQLAWSCYLAGDFERARHAADDALRLDGMMPHDELKLKHQTLSGRTGQRRGGGGVPSVGGGHPEQLMREIRKSRSRQ